MTASTKAPAGSGEQLGLAVKSGVPAVREEATVAVRPITEGGTASVFQLMQQAIEKGTDVAALEKLMDLAERATNREAALEFARAMAAFQAECPPIKKSSTAKIATRGGSSYSYTYAELDEIARVVNPILRKHGLSYSWNSKVDEKGVMLTCTCIVRHVNGHSETAEFTLPIANESAMNNQQKVAAALTFAKRQSLVAALGLVTTDEDTDTITREIDPTPISDDQLNHLEDLIEETKTDIVRFLKYLDVAALKDLPAGRYQQALTALERKKAGAK